MVKCLDYLRRKCVSLIRGFLLAIVLIFVLLPIIWIIMTSFKTPLQMISIPPVIFFRPTLESYLGLFARAKYLMRNLYNSIVISSLTAFLSLSLGALAAFSFSRFRFAGSQFLAFLLVCARTLPPIVAVVPLFLSMSRWNLVDTHLGLTLIYTALNLPFAIWMLKSFFDAVPKDLEESAMIDGCSRFKACYKITLPLAAPGLAATAIFVFVLAWNEFMFALIFSSVNAKTMPVMVVESIVEYKIYWADMAALGTIVMLPVLIFSFFVQRHLVTGLTVGAIK